MKSSLTVAVIASVLAGPSVSWAQSSRAGAPRPSRAEAPASPARKLSRAEFDALLRNPSAVTVLDVRRPDEVQSIGGFPVYLSIQASELEKFVAFIPRDRAVVPVSNHAGRAGRAAAILEKAGFRVAGVIGAQDYEAEGGTLVKLAPPAPQQSGGR